MKLGRLDIKKLGNWPHEPNIKSLIPNLTFLKSIKINLMLRYFELPLLINKILNHIFNLTLIFVGNLYLKNNTSGRFFTKLSSSFFI